MDWDPNFDYESYHANRRLEIADGKRGRANIAVYRTDAIVLRKGFKPKCADMPKCPRGRIGAAPSARSLANLVFVLNNSDVPMRSMLTLTMTPRCHQACSTETHRLACKRALQRLRDKCYGDYVWVREFQANGSVHWHIFLERDVGFDGAVNEELSHEWTMWWSSLYWDKLIPTASTPAAQKSDRLSRSRMERGNGQDFLGCCRIEKLRSDAAGKYAAKEGAKRFQKIAPGMWREAGGAWWRASGGVTCTPIKTTTVAAHKLQTATVKINGKECEIAYRLQHNLGLKSRPSSDDFGN